VSGAWLACIHHGKRLTVNGNRLYLISSPKDTIIPFGECRRAPVLRVAVPTDDGFRVSRRFGRANSFVVADVGLGMIVESETRKNPAGSGTRERAASKGPVPSRDRHILVADALADCRAVIAYAIGGTMRARLANQGIEVVITSEALVDRALALFVLASLKDESLFDTDDFNGMTSLKDGDGEAHDDFDG